MSATQIFQNIPQELKSISHWCNWKYGEQKKNGKFAKPPCTPDGIQFDHNKSNFTFDQCVKAVGDNDILGIGLSLTKELGVTIIDLDGCVEPNGAANPEAWQVIQEANSYTELSPSGTGFHIVTYGTIPSKLGSSKKDIYEMYDHGQYVTFTGNVYGHFNTYIANQDFLNNLHQTISDKRGTTSTNNTPVVCDWNNLPEEKLVHSKLMRNSTLYKHCTDPAYFNGDDRSGFIYGMLKDMCRAGFTNEEIAVVVGWNDFSISSVFADKYRGRDFKKAFERDLKNAIASVDTEEPNTTGVLVAHPDTSLDDLFGRFTLTEEKVAKCEEAVFIVPDLIVRSQITTIAGKSNAGKTTIIESVLPFIVKQGYVVRYFDLDSPPSEYKRMVGNADKYGYTVVNPIFDVGNSVNDLMELLKDLANSPRDLSKEVYFFDTLKKFCNVMEKGSAKRYFELQRTLTAKGATIGNLGHTNKHPDREGNLVFEGTGDIQNDSDNLLYLESKGDKSSSICTFTPENTRAMFSPSSYEINISEDGVRTVFKLDEAVDLKNIAGNSIAFRSNIDADNIIKKAINNGFSLTQHIVDYCREHSNLGDNKIRDRLRCGSEGKSGTPWLLVTEDRAKNNSKRYSINPQSIKGVF